MKNVLALLTKLMNNNNNYDNNNDYDYNTIIYVYVGFFLLAIICFCVFAYFKWFKNKYTLTRIDNYKNKKINI